MDTRLRTVVIEFKDEAEAKISDLYRRAHELLTKAVEEGYHDVVVVVHGLDSKIHLTHRATPPAPADGGTGGIVVNGTPTA